MSDSNKSRRLILKSLLCVYIIGGIYGLTVVPGFSYLLLIPVAILVASLFFLRKISSKVSLIISSAISLALGGLGRIMGEGMSSVAIYLLMVVLFICLGCSMYIYENEKT
jgi:hypothetical protein